MVQQVFDESNSPYTAANKALFAGNTQGGLNADDFVTFSKKHTINGGTFCSTKGLTATVNDRVRWHVATLVSTR